MPIVHIRKYNRPDRTRMGGNLAVAYCGITHDMPVRIPWAFRMYPLYEEEELCGDCSILHLADDNTKGNTE